MHDVLATPVRRAGQKCEAVSPFTGMGGWPTVAYGIAAVSGGAMTGGLLAVAGVALRMMNVVRPEIGTAIGLTAAGLLTAVALVLQARGRVQPLPQRHRQLPRRLRLWPSRTRAAIVWGFMLGSGVFTYLHYAAAYIIATWVVVSGSLRFGVIVGGVYGLVRALTLIAGALETLGEKPRPTILLAAASAAERSLILASLPAAVTLLITAVASLSSV